MKLKVFFLKVEYEGDLRISEFNSLHLTNADAKKAATTTTTWKSPSFYYFLVVMNCYLKELSQTF